MIGEEMANEVIIQYLQDDIELVRKSDYHETFYFYEDDGVTPKDTTDWLMTLWIEKGNKTLDTLETDGTRIINTPGSGQFNLNFTKAEIDAYEWATGTYRINIDYGDGNYQVWRKGNIKVV